MPDNYSSIQNQGKIRTRFAPSPTGYMHVGGLRTALYAYLIAKKSGGTFILRIEDTDRARYVDGATQVIMKTLKDAGLHYDEGPDVGGPAGPYVQSQRQELYRPYALQLCEKGAAYYCFCTRGEGHGESYGEGHGEGHSDESDTAGGRAAAQADPCRELPPEVSARRVAAGEAHVIRMKTPRDGETVVDDVVFGRVVTPNKDLDDMVLLKSDGMPTYNFANVIDDHLMGITHVVRGSEYISSAPKYNLLYEALGWEIPVYITVSPIMRDERHKLSKRDGDPTYDDLIGQGYLPDAVLNYVALLGWSPGGERELFTLDELLEVFDVKGISKAPAIFDIIKLNYFNSEYIRRLSPEQFAEAARPYIRSVVKNENIDADTIAGLLQARCEKLSDIPEKVDFFEALPQYDIELFVHEKSKTDKAISLKMLLEAEKVLQTLSEWTKESIHDILIALAQKLGVKNATLMWPVRIATAGRAVTPGGAVEICLILGKNEALKRIGKAITVLESSE